MAQLRATLSAAININARLLSFLRSVGHSAVFLFIASSALANLSKNWLMVVWWQKKFLVGVLLAQLGKHDEYFKHNKISPSEHAKHLTFEHVWKHRRIINGTQYWKYLITPTKGTFWSFDQTDRPRESYNCEFDHTKLSTSMRLWGTPDREVVSDPGIKFTTPCWLWKAHNNLVKLNSHDSNTIVKKATVISANIPYRKSWPQIKTSACLPGHSSTFTDVDPGGNGFRTERKFQLEKSDSPWTHLYPCLDRLLLMHHGLRRAERELLIGIEIRINCAFNNSNSVSLRWADSASVVNRDMIHIMSQGHSWPRACKVRISIPILDEYFWTATKFCTYKSAAVEAT